MQVKQDNVIVSTFTQWKRNSLSHTGAGQNNVSHKEDCQYVSFSHIYCTCTNEVWIFQDKTTFLTIHYYIYFQDIKSIINIVETHWQWI